MESVVQIAFDAYRTKLAQFASALKNRVKTSSSLKALKEGVGLTANMYYQRLNYPQNIPPEEAAALANLLNDESIIHLYNEAQELGHQLTLVLADYLKEAKMPVTFICQKLNMDTSNFYRKQKDPRLWSLPEIEKITQVVETIKNL